jgi:hypothetical protein
MMSALESHRLVGGSRWGCAGRYGLRAYGLPIDLWIVDLPGKWKEF